MRIFISIFIMIFVTVPVYAQELVDTLKTRELSEVVVKAQMQRTSPTSTTYALQASKRMPRKMQSTSCGSWLYPKFK